MTQGLGRCVCCCAQCVSGKRCPVWRALNCSCFCWKVGRRTERPPRPSSLSLFTDLWATAGNGTHDPRLPSNIISFVVTLVSAAQHTTCTGQRFSHATVRGGIWLHPGVPEDDWWAGDPRPPCRPISGFGAPAASEETSGAVSSWRTNHRRSHWQYGSRWNWILQVLHVAVKSRLWLPLSEKWRSCDPEDKPPDFIFPL